MHKLSFSILTLLNLLSIILPLNIVSAQITSKKSTFHLYKNSPQILQIRGMLAGNEQAFPNIEHNSDQKAIFEFDLLGSDTKNFSYHIIHCDASWDVSELLSSEFMDGFNENQVTDYLLSTNTTFNYINYRVTIPNDDVLLKKTGNYILRIFEDSNRDSTVAMFPFRVYEQLVNIDAEIVRPIHAEYSKNSQEIRLKINHGDVEVNDPFNEIKVMIFQNNRPEMAIKNLKPNFVNDRELVYNLEGEYILPGNNEFRAFDTKSLKNPDGTINTLQFKDSLYFINLFADESRGFKRYFSEQDINGHYIIFSEGAWDNRNSGNYVKVNFTLKMPTPILDGSIHVYGELSNWDLSPANAMTYNFDKSQYELSMLLKQGYYNYSYVYRNNYTGETEENTLEGSHFQTENNYFIYVYHHGFGENYDSLIGIQVVNSILK